MNRFGALCVMLLLSTAAFGQDAASAFPAFCEEWMHKLEVREQHNVTHISWETNGSGVQGVYIGYTHEHTCTLKDGTGHVPVGEIIYREIRYEKQGATRAEAEQSAARQSEVTEVTEIFRYSDGKWIY